MKKLLFKIAEKLFLNFCINFSKKHGYIVYEKTAAQRKKEK